MMFCPFFTFFVWGVFFSLGKCLLIWGVLYSACELLKRRVVPAFASVMDQRLLQKVMRFELHVAFVYDVPFCTLGGSYSLGVVLLALRVFHTLRLSSLIDRSFPRSSDI